MSYIMSDKARDNTHSPLNFKNFTCRIQLNGNIPVKFAKHIIMTNQRYRIGVLMDTAYLNEGNMPEDKKKNNKKQMLL